MDSTTRIASTAVTDRPGPGRRRANPAPGTAARLRRWRNVCLATAIGLITVAVPPLLIPDRDPAPVKDAQQDAQPQPGPSQEPSSTAASPASSPAASAASSAGRPSASAGATVSRPPSGAAGAAPCATSGGAASPPACTVYTNTLGPGWQAAGAGANVFPAERVPGSDVVAIRVEPKQDGASVWLSAGTAATVPGTLRLRVYGGRVNGTVARVSLSSTATADRSRTALINAPADVWTEFEFPVASLLPDGGRTVQRIDFMIVDEAVPASYRFFIDDIAFVQR
ncbi:hypothetical protein [Dactylosporangium sp. CA-233914]|uniref:hypothetical protein n=1 Tax=Dactylosporangium sp. CA-233914 TaxID=3239934 RepID=UPI003D911FAA